MVQVLEHRGGFWESDSALLAVLAQNYSEYDRLTRVLIDEEEFYEYNKRKYSHPASAARKNSLKHIKEISAHFRLAPKFRNEILKDPDREENPIEKLKRKYAKNDNGL